MNNSPVGAPMRFGWLVAGLAFTTLVLSACKPQAVAPTSTPVSVIVLPTPIIVLPSPTVPPAPTSTPALPPGLSSLIGSWVLDLNYRIVGYPIYSDIRYVGSLPLTVGPDGSLSGSGLIYTTLVQPPCNAQVTAGNGAPVTISGQIESDTPAVDSKASPLIADVSLIPQDSNARQTFQLICSDAALSDSRDVLILWPALTATGQLHIRFPFQLGVVLSGIRDLTLPSNETLFGILSYQVRIGQ